MFKTILNSTTYLQLLERKHADELFYLIDGSKESIGKWLSFPTRTEGVEDCTTFIEKSLQRYAKNNGYWAGIWHEGRLVGSIGYLYIDSDAKKTEIGYWLGKEYEGKGLATIAVRAMITNAFRNLHLEKVEINVASQNWKSQRIPKQLGFKEEGVIRNYEYLNGEYLDRVVYGLLRHEWKIREMSSESS
ncbi:Putative ribosomal N-acetyltransferase YdaF [Bacillus sp. THAF10]|uniref:GNAT family N-acetyltransferase n=1 Tax=Bacillus sp. THAF10 TaxID=2587848 RepID=UPI001269680B|nr:GNAT family protein [Bacillus sp. THAF10]QFT89581.1 Putative ribosomal N-acetyltransferase YdaF [Bacillus sp. THAF10]